MRIFIDFWKLEIENSLLHVFNFLPKLNFENSFCFLSILDCQTSFLVLKIEKCFWKQKIRRKNSYQTYFYILCVKLLRLYAIGFCNWVLPNLHCWWSEELCSQQHLFKLLELVTYLGSMQRVNHKLEVYASRERMLLQDQIQLGIKAKVQL